MIRINVLVVTLLSSLLLFPSTSNAAASTSALTRCLEEQIELERWRPGGLNSQGMLRIFRQAIQTGDIEVVAEALDELVRQARRGRVDLELFLPLLPEIGKLSRKGTAYENFDVASVLREQAIFYGLSRSERREIYRQALLSQREQPGSSRRFIVRGEVFWESWYSAATSALQHQMDDLLPLIEQGHYTGRWEPRDGATESLERHVSGVLLPLAKARSSRDWVGQYLSLMRRALAGGGRKETRSVLIREAALDLVAKNRRDAVPRLKEILAPWANARREPSAEFTVDQDSAAQAIVGAVRALGDSEFEERLWRRWHPVTAEQLDCPLQIQRFSVEPRGSSMSRDMTGQ